MADALDTLERPDVVTIHQVRQVSDASFTEWLTERKNARQASHRLDTCGYQPLRNPDAKDGLWKVASKPQAIFMRQELSFNEPRTAAKKAFGILTGRRHCGRSVIVSDKNSLINIRTQNVPDLDH